MQRRTRRSASTIGGAAPDTVIGRAAADRAGARPYRATRCENASKMRIAGSRGSASLPPEMADHVPFRGPPRIVASTKMMLALVIEYRLS